MMTAATVAWKNTVQSYIITRATENNTAGRLCQEIVVALKRGLIRCIGFFNDRYVNFGPKCAIMRLLAPCITPRVP